MQLTKNFYLSEFITSQTASRLNLDNTPSKTVIKNLKLLAEKILQPIRDAFDKPVIISSGYRSLAVNRAVGSTDKSQHVKGEAADFEIPSVDNYELAQWIHKNLNYDQLILEFYTGGNSGWIHVGYSPRHLNQELTINRFGSFSGLKKY
jgi:zinc D-Ala-D-Ala carboxypeptidase